MEHPTLRFALALHLLSACAIAEDPELLAAGGVQSPSPTLPPTSPTPVNGAGGRTGAPNGGAGGAAGAGGAGAAGREASDGGRFTSDVFGSGHAGATGGSGACDPAPAGTCDWARLDGCCKPLACERANGTDVFNMYPVDSCQALIACVQAHPGCSSASDPLCFGNESPTAPCLNEGYKASHTDPAGPYAWTVELVRCVCGY